MKKIAAVIAFSILAPIWWYLLYQILVRVNASELMWFLYWVYIPAAVVGGIITKLAEDE